MVNIWLMIVNNNLVGGIPTPLKNDGVRQLNMILPNMMGKSCHPFMFQSPPTRHIVIPMINHRLTID